MSPSLIMAKKKKRNKQNKNKKAAAVICSLCNNSRSRRSQSHTAHVSFHGVGFADCTVGLMSRETKGPPNHSSSEWLLQNKSTLNNRTKLERVVTLHSKRPVLTRL